VGGEDHRRAAGRKRGDELPQPGSLSRVEAGARLVEQQHHGLGEQTDRDVDPLLVSARQSRHLVVAAVGEVALIEHLLDARLDVVVSLEAGEQPQVLFHREAAVEGRLLGHPADLAAR